jgi:hypothetical protein
VSIALRWRNTARVLGRSFPAIATVGRCGAPVPA